VRKTVLSPSTWILAAVSVSLVVLLNGRLLQAPLAMAASPRDAADQYVQALQTGNVDGFLASLAPQARSELGTLGRVGGIPGSQAERRAARMVLAHDHIDRYTRMGQHPTEDGSFVVYAVERDAADGTHTTPLVVWLDRDGHVVHTTL
jgi:hypothetical protein